MISAGESSVDMASTLGWLHRHGIGGIVNYHTEGGFNKIGVKPENDDCTVEDSCQEELQRTMEVRCNCDAID